MDDPDAVLEPIDRAYADAEALVADDAARAQRRARVLGEIARADVAAGAATPARTGRSMLRSSGWLAAAGVVGLSVFIAVQAPQRPPVAAPAPQSAPAAGAVVADVGPAPTQKPTSPPPALAEAAPSNVPRIAPALPPVAPPRRSEGPIGALARGPDAPTAANKATNAATSVPPDDAMAAVAPVVAAREGAFAASPPPPPMAALRATPGPADRLRAAAAAGRNREVEDLLAQGTPVDAPDADGDTALMKSVAAGRAQTAALLRRYGASLDRRNREGQSVRDVAEAMDNEEVNEAIGVKPRP